MARALRQGSTCPPRENDDLLRLYSMRLCPFAQRARLVLAYKGIPHETVNIDLYRKPDWYFEKNPLGTVPTLEMKDGNIVYESLVCAEFLDEAFPGPRLTPADHYAKARQKMLIDRFGKVISKFYTIMGLDEYDEHLKELEDALLIFEKGLNSPYFGGDTPQMVDVAILPFLERLEALQIYTKDKFDYNKYPKLKELVGRMHKFEVFKDIANPPEWYATFYPPYLRRQPFDCDIGLD